LDVNVIQKLMILTVSVLLDKSARIVNVGNLFLRAASVIQSLIIQMNCVQMISGVSAANVKTVHNLLVRVLAREETQTKFLIHLLCSSLIPPSLSNLIKTQYLT